MSEQSSPQEGIWCVVANVASQQLFGEEHELHSGTKHFSPNTKVYCFPPQWGDGYEKIRVIGHHRGSPKLVTMLIPSKRLVNWRVKYVYHPYVIRQMIGWQKDRAELIVASILLGREAKQVQHSGFDQISSTNAD